MGNDDRVLSQAEIDALLSSNSVSVPAKPPPPPAPKAAAPAAPAGPPKVAVASPPVTVAPKPAVPPAPKAAAPPPAVAPKAVAPPPAPPAPKAAPVYTPAPAPAAQQGNREGPTPDQVSNLCKKIISEETRDLTKQIVELTIKVKKIDDVRQRMEQVEEKLDRIAEMVQASPRAVEDLGSRMDEIYTMLETLQHGRKQGDEERIHDQFHCVKCHSEKLVAIHVKCTSCGMENWMGWFPEVKHESLPEHY